MTLDEATRQKITQNIENNSVVLFMKGTPAQPQCGFSATVVQILSELAADYSTVNVLEDPAIREGIKTYSNWPTIPQLFIDGEFIGGCDIVKDMHARKQRMYELADGFAVLPGGLGTLDEAIEVITWRQLHLHDKPIALLDNDGYWGWLPSAINRLVAGGFAPEKSKNLFTILHDADELIDIVDVGAGSE